MYVDYGGEPQHVGMGIKAMKSFGRPRGKRMFKCNMLIIYIEHLNEVSDLSKFAYIT